MIIIGACNMRRGIATHAIAGGHEAEMVDRDPAQASKLAGELGGSATAIALPPARAQRHLRQRDQAGFVTAVSGLST